jgi:hypothetical protein
MKTLAQLGIVNDVQNILITPDLAAELLKHNNGNRDVRNAKVNEYAYYMKEGLWGQCEGKITFDPQENLNNGQKRLMAVCKSGTSQVFTVERNFTNHPFVDNTQKRGVLDNQKMLSSADKNKVDERIAFGKMKEIVNTLLYDKIRSGSPYPNETIAAYKHWEKELIAFLPVVKYGKFKAPVYAAMFIAYLNGVKLERLMEFASTLDDGLDHTASNLSAVPIITFRDKLVTYQKGTAGGGSAVSKDILGRTQYAIRMYVKGSNKKRNQCTEYYSFSAAFLNTPNRAVYD